VRGFVLLALVVLGIAGSATTGSPGGPPSTSGAPASVWQLRYVLLGHYPNFAFCDPDYYPVARADE
jgi:hypothetical protein